VNWRRLEPADAGFLSTAPIRHVVSVDLDVPVDRVWASLISEESLGAWGVGVRVTWTCPAPRGVGATREVRLPGGAATLREHFFRWDEGSGYSFYVTEANRSVFARFAEDYVVESTPTGSRFTWTMAIEPAPGRVGRLLLRTDGLTGSSYGLLGKAAQRYFRKHPTE
jgi:hypothetical protein